MNVLINWVVCSYPYCLASFQREVCFSFRACQGPQTVSLEFWISLAMDFSEIVKALQQQLETHSDSIHNATAVGNPL